MRDEPVDIVDDQDRPVAVGSKREAYDKKQTIRIVHVFILNAKGEMALQLRSQNISFCPGHWVTAGSGHVQAGETYSQAGERELLEEIGVTTPLTFKGAEHYTQPDGMNKFLGVLEGTYDGDITKHPEDVDDVRYFSMAEIKQMVSSREKIHPEFLYLLKRKYGI